MTRHGRPHPVLLHLTLCLATAAPAFASNAAPTPDATEFFEKKIRPVLVDECYKCHSAQSEKLKGKLLLDTREGLLKGGDTGPAITPGDPDKSLLIQAIRYTNEDLQMPPKKRLTKDQVADFEAWVKMGAPDPRTPTSPSTDIPPAPPVLAKLPIAEAKKFWSFQPPRNYPPPTVAHTDWPRTPIDAFVLARLEEKNLTPAPPADRRTLIRRATFDLIGLPPTPAEVAAFESDPSPGAFEKVIDRLLVSPQYGQRWARYWLDVARYADTKGYVAGGEERRFPFSYTYRDWVVQAFNSDMPYDQFLTYQIAADRELTNQPSSFKKENLAAMGFLTVGRRFLGSQADIIDDRLDVIFRGTQAMTVACARCHDHKFDPIPTADYYSLYGVFASSTEPKDLPVVGEPPNKQEFAAYKSDLAARQSALDQYPAQRHAELLASLRSARQIEDYLLAADAATRKAEQPDQTGRRRRREGNLSRLVIENWTAFLKKTATPNDPVFAAWHALAAIPAPEFAAKSPATLKNLPDTINPLIAKALTEKPLTSLQDAAHAYAAVLAQSDSPTPHPDPAKEQLRQVLRAPGSPCDISLAQVPLLYTRADDDKIRALQAAIDALKVTSPGAPPCAMVLEDLPQPVNPYVFKRGNPSNTGEAVPRQFLAVLSPSDRKPFTDGSGRLKLARAIASKDNPLTARVIVNRTWLHHFGQGLVRTPSDFGSRGDLPTHPELLDYLATRFMNDGWSIKKLHKLIMLSAVYQQSSNGSPKATEIDPDNRLLWKMNRQRLDFEATRDALLAAAGALDLSPGGRPVNILTQPFSTRRTLYGYVDRQNLPGLFRSFDFASPDTTSPQRFTTTVPQQALFMMNSPFVIEQAKRLVARPEVSHAPTPDEKIRQLYRLAYDRLPAPDELKLALSFVNGDDASDATPLAPAPAPAWQYGYGYFDESTGRVRSFTRFPHFTGQSWQGGPDLPDPTSGWAMLTATGGHPGNDPQHAVIRRWTAPSDGVLAITGTLAHAEAQGNGIRATITSARQGRLAAWTAEHSTTKTPLDDIQVRTGDVLDFVVDCRGEVNFDSFTWTARLRLSPRRGITIVPADRAEWSSSRDFSGPASPPKPLSAWEKYAQVLLESNEFVFVD